MNPTEHEKQIAQEYAGQLPECCMPWLNNCTQTILAAITAAKQQQNEDTARLIRCLKFLPELAYDTIIKQEGDPQLLPNVMQAVVDDCLADRGVQPAATEDCGNCKAEKSVVADVCQECGYSFAAAKQESAPTPEQQQTETGGKWSRYGSAVVDAAKAWEFGKDTLFVCASADDAKKAIALHAAVLAAKDEQLRAQTQIKEAEKLILLDEVAKNAALREQLRVMREALKKINAHCLSENICRTNLAIQNIRRWSHDALASAPVAQKQERAQ